jgi:lipoyl(octanoyl) transferase
MREERGVLGSRCTLLRPGLTDYQRGLEIQRRAAESVRDGGEPSLILLEHPPVYTLGVRGRRGEHLHVPREAIEARGALVVETDRGGDVTFHGPGQLVGYPVLDLHRLGRGPVAYVRGLEAVVIETLARFGIVGGRVAGRPGVWVKQAKIAAIGVRVARGVTTHGFALNVSTDLSYFGSIVPCGLADAGVTSMLALTGVAFAMSDVEAEVVDAFGREFSMEVREDIAAEVTVGR